MAASTRFTETLRLAADEQWDRVINHKFAKELAAGTIDRNGMFRSSRQAVSIRACFISLTLLARSLSIEKVSHSRL